MTAAPAQAREHGRSIPARAVLLIGEDSLAQAIQHLFASSPWTLLREAGMDRAVDIIKNTRIPVVLCDETDVETVEAGVSKLHPTPLLIALSANDRLPPGIHACARSAFLMNVHRIVAGEWFSLLNQAWRTNEWSSL